MIERINTPNAPSAIGTYNQATRAGDWLFISGQISLDPKTMMLVPGDFKAQVKQTFDNLEAVLKASESSFSDITKLTIYLLDLSHFELVNDEMALRFASEYPARAVLGVSALPKGSQVEMDAIVYLGSRA